MRALIIGMVVGIANTAMAYAATTDDTCGNAQRERERLSSAIEQYEAQLAHIKQKPVLMESEMDFLLSIALQSEIYRLKDEYARLTSMLGACQ